MSDDCTCEHYVVDYSDPDRYHSENVDREDNPLCPAHGGDQDCTARGFSGEGRCIERATVGALCEYHAEMGAL